MSDYNIPCLVPAFPCYTGIHKIREFAGTVIMLRDGESFIGPEGENWSWKKHWVIPHPTPAQIKEEARKAGKAPMIPDTTPTPKTKPAKADPVAQAIEDSIARTNGLLELAKDMVDLAGYKGGVKRLAAKVRHLRAKWMPEAKKSKKAK